MRLVGKKYKQKEKSGRREERRAQGKKNDRHWGKGKNIIKYIVQKNLE